MDLCVPETIEGQLKCFQGAVDDLEAALQPLLNQDYGELSEKMTPLERAQWHMMMASSAYRLTEMYFKAHGKNPRAHGKLEIEKKRVMQYEQRVQKAVKDYELRRSSRSSTVNVAAANRFIDNALPDLTKEQKISLRKVPGQLPSKAPKEASQVQPKKKRKAQPSFGLGFLQDMLEDVRKEAHTHNNKVAASDEDGVGEVENMPKGRGSCEEMISDEGEGTGKKDNNS